MRAVLTIATLLVLVACSSAAPPQAAAPTPIIVPAILTPSIAPTVAPSATPTTATSATPAGPLLRDVWPPAPPGTRPVSALVYCVELPYQDERTERKSAILSFNLSDPLKSRTIAEFPVDSTDDSTPVGQVSPDGSAIVYVLPGVGGGTLFAMRRDGTDQRTIMKRVSIQSSDSHSYFVWSPDSTQIATIQSASDQITLVVYDFQSHKASEPLLLGSAFLVGWQDTQHVLTVASSGQGQPSLLERIDVITKQRQVLYEIGGPTGLIYSMMSPDRQKAIIGRVSDVYVFNTANNTLNLIMTPYFTAWNPDSATLIAFDRFTPGKALIYSHLLEHPTTSMAVVSMPPISPPLGPAEPIQLPPDLAGKTTVFDFLAASPDGRYFVFRGEDPRRQDPQIPQTLVSRVLIYDSATDHWQQLREGHGVFNILGWE